MEGLLPPYLLKVGYEAAVERPERLEEIERKNGLNASMSKTDDVKTFRIWRTYKRSHVMTLIPPKRSTRKQNTLQSIQVEKQNKCRQDVPVRGFREYRRSQPRGSQDVEKGLKLVISRRRSSKPGRAKKAYIPSRTFDAANP
jgi:hypothetical protein